MKKRIAIACQGGGSHNAFTSGVLQQLLQHWPSDHDLVGFSGTSGGGICATLAWSGLLAGGAGCAVARLQAFWRENAATAAWESCLNHSMVAYQHWMSYLSLPEISPYKLPNWGQEQLGRLLERHIPFDELPGQLHAGSPALVLGAVDVLSGEFRVFEGRHGLCTISRDALLASAAIPNVFRAVDIGGRLYWDGLFSQNPPIHELTALEPDEIWVIQINAQQRKEEPVTLEDIRDRRNELGGNLSLNQEVRMVERINRLLRDDKLAGCGFKNIDFLWIKQEMDLSHLSKMNRQPRFLEELADHGREQADRALHRIGAAT